MIYNNIQVNVHKGGKSLRALGPHIWHSLSEHIKAEANFIKFKELEWFGSICKYNLCVYVKK